MSVGILHHGGAGGRHASGDDGAGGTGGRGGDAAVTSTDSTTLTAGAGGGNRGGPDHAASSFTLGLAEVAALKSGRFTLMTSDDAQRAKHQVSPTAEECVVSGRIPGAARAAVSKIARTTRIRALGVRILVILVIKELGLPRAGRVSDGCRRARARGEE